MSIRIGALLLVLAAAPVACSRAPMSTTPHVVVTDRFEATDSAGAATAASSDFDAGRPPTASALPLIELPGGLVVDREKGELRMPAVVAIEAGFLEQAVCMRNTRDHEAVLVVDLLPSRVHAGLMMLGLDPGAPGSWSYEPIPETDRVRVERKPPTGALVEILVRVTDPSGELRELPIADWIAGVRDGAPFPVVPWVFGGSRFERFRPDEPEFYLADQSGSLVGLVTFGDEVLGLRAVRSDQVAVDGAEWEIRTGEAPRPGTVVELVMRSWDDG